MTRSVVIVAFDGMQPLDAVGPHEVFAGATAVLASRKRAMSSRHFSRVFTDQVGETPARYVERVRVEAARAELELTASSLDLIATNCGLGSAESLRRAFQRRIGVAPDAYRRRFRSHPKSNARRLDAVS